MQHPRTQAWHEGHRNGIGDHNGKPDGHRKTLEEFPDDPAHVGYGDEHRKQHRGDGKNGKRHLFDPLYRRFEFAHTRFHLLVDVLQYDNGVVNDDTDGERQPDKGHFVQVEPHEIHQRDRTHNGDGNRERRDNGNGKVSQETEDNDDRQKRTVNQVELHIFERVDNERRRILKYLYAVFLTCHLLKCGDCLFDPFDDLKRIGTGDLLHFKHHTRCTVVRSVTVRIAERIFHLCHILKTDIVLDDNIFKLLDTQGIGFGLENELFGFGNELTSADLHIFTGDDGIEFTYGNAEFVQHPDIGKDLDLSVAIPDNVDRTHPVDLLNGRFDLLIGKEHQLFWRCFFCRQKEIDHRCAADIELAYQRCLGIFGKHYRRDLVSHIVGRFVDVTLQKELDHDHRSPLGTGGSDGIHPADTRDRLFYLFRYLRLYRSGFGSGVDGLDGDHRKIDVGKECGGHAFETEPSEDHQCKDIHQCRYRPVYG